MTHGEGEWKEMLARIGSSVVVAVLVLQMCMIISETNTVSSKGVEPTEERVYSVDEGRPIVYRLTTVETSADL